MREKNPLLKMRIAAPLTRVKGWLRGRFGRTSPEDVTDFAKVLACMVVGIDPSTGEPSRSLSTSLLESLKEDEDWPYDLGEAEANETEGLSLNLWSVSYAFCSKTSVLTPWARNVFISKVETLVFRDLIDGGVAPPAEATNLSLLYQSRFVEYSEAFQSDQSARNETPPRNSFDFFRAVTRNLFGRQSNNLVVMAKVMAATWADQLSLLQFFTVSGLHMKIARGLTRP
jgi:hypothetical protein